MSKSLIDLIKQAILTESPKGVSIDDCSLVSELIESDKKGDPFALYDFLPRSYRGKNLALTHHLLYFLRCIVLFFIGILYALYDLLHKIVTGEWKSKPLDEEVKARRIPDKKWIKQLHTEKWRGIKSSSGLNIIILVVSLVMAIITLVWGIHFFIKEVMLPDNNSRINGYGVVTIDQGCFEEQHFFLLNAATLWAHTGIAVSEGDKVFITASGSMYSDVGDMVNAAKGNKKLKYPRSSFHSPYDKMDPNAIYCIYGRYPEDRNPKSHKDNQPVFGSLLYQICDEVKGPKPFNNDKNPEAVKQINFSHYSQKHVKEKRFHFNSKESGMLCFSFNDILLDDATIDNIIKNKDDGHSEGVYESLMRTMPNCSLCPCLAKCQNFKNEVDSLIWFDDNFGEALINVRIQKNIWNSPLSFHKKVMMGSYRFFHNNRLTFILIILSWFVLDGIVSWILKKE